VFQTPPRNRRSKAHPDCRGIFAVTVTIGKPLPPKRWLISGFDGIERQGDVRRVLELVGERRQFVVKPTRGSEGRGIVLIVDRRGNRLRTAGEKTVWVTDLRYHLSAVPAGLAEV